MRRMHAFLRMLLRATSGLVLFECTVRHDGWFPPQFFRTDLLVREGERKPKLFHLLEFVKSDQCVRQILQHGQASYLSSSIDIPFAFTLTGALAFALRN